MRKVVVFEQLPLRRDRSAVQAMLARLALSARGFGLQVVAVPYGFDEIAAAEALDRVNGDQGAVGVLVGFISEPSFYSDLYDAALPRGITMINTPDQSLSVMEFDRYYASIRDLTARSVIIRTPQDCERAITELGSPVFVKGLVKSRKEGGWSACVEHDADGLRARLRQSSRYEISERGVLVARQILPLRRNEHQVAGFPVSREYRAYVLDRAMIGYGFYWRAHDSFGSLTSEEVRGLSALVSETARRVDARLVAVDVGQLTDGSWRVIELGDPQFSGIAHMPHHLFWHALQSSPPEAPCSPA